MSSNFLMLSCWKWSLASMASKHVVLEPMFVLSWGICNIVLSVVGPPMYFCMLSALSYKSTLVASRINRSMCLSTSSRTWFLCLALVREPASVHSLPQLLVVPAHQPILVLFSLSLHLTFVLLPISASQLLFFLRLLYFLSRSQFFNLQTLIFSLPSLWCLCPLLPFTSTIKVVCMNIESTFALHIFPPLLC